MTNAIHTRDLREFLETQHLSPEAFARQVELSHMTIRRWLKNSDDWVIPHKYHPILRDRIVQENNTHAFEVNHALVDLDFGALMAGIQRTGEAVVDLEALERDLKKKRKNLRLDQIFFQFCDTLLKPLSLPRPRPRRERLRSAHCCTLLARST